MQVKPRSQDCSQQRPEKNAINKHSLVGKDTALIFSGYTGTLQICDHKHPWHPLERTTPSSSDVHRYLLLQDQEQNPSN